MKHGHGVIAGPERGASIVGDNRIKPFARELGLGILLKIVSFSSKADFYKASMLFEAGQNIGGLGVGREGFEPSTNWLKANCSTD